MKDIKPVFIRGDLNALRDGVIPLRNEVWVALLKKTYGQINDGQQIWLYELTGDDPTVFPGTIRDIGKDDEYEILVNESDFEYLSESEECRGLTRDDLERGWKEEVKNHPGYNR